MKRHRAWRAPVRVCAEDLLSGGALRLILDVAARMRGVDTPEAEVTYAIGDVHGRWAALTALLSMIAEDAAGRTMRIVTLGDMVDKGPSSAKVVETLRRMQAVLPEGSLVCLAGNHEKMMEEALEGRDPEGSWITREDRGGATLRSYGLAWSQSSLGRLPREHVLWIRGLPLRHEDASCHYVHAGFRPGVDLAGQTAWDMTTLKGPFLDSGHDFGKHVVHGHAPTSGEPERFAGRTNVDGGCGAGRRLCAVATTAGETRPSRFLSVGADGLGAGGGTW